jgi:DNA-binding NtrC family response regulator
MSRILIIDDEPAIGWSLREVLAEEGHAVELAASVEAGLETCGRQAPEAILLDVRLPGRDGISALPEFRAVVPDSPIIVMTAFGDLDTAVRAIEAGAFDYLVKPFALDHATQVASRALAARGVASGRAGRPRSADRVSLVGGSPPMQAVFKQIALVAATDLPVLITGETGTGKELAARAIHAHGSRRDRPLVVTSLASLAPSVVESELFGHVRGAFTGAASDRPGLFAEADGGTVFLDEIGDAAPDVQTKLLRVLERQEVVPVGSGETLRVDVRVIAATNRDLPAAIAAGWFRADLYHRLRVFPIEMPPLAARCDDLPLLVEAFLRDAGADTAAATPAFLDAVRRRPWPGNVRELEHAIAFAAVMARGGMLRPEHLPPLAAGNAGTVGAGDDDVAAAVRRWLRAKLAGDAGATGLRDLLAGVVDATLAAEAVEMTDGNRTAAAKLLGVDRSTLRTKLQ